MATASQAGMAPGQDAQGLPAALEHNHEQLAYMVAGMGSAGPLPSTGSLYYHYLQGCPVGVKMSLMVDEADLEREEFVRKVESDLWHVPPSFHEGGKELITCLEFLKVVRKRLELPIIYVLHGDLPLLVKKEIVASGEVDEMAGIVFHSLGGAVIDLDAMDEQCGPAETGKEQEPLHSRSVKLSLALPTGVDELNSATCDVLEDGGKIVGSRVDGTGDGSGGGGS
eukprot:6214813-Pleurochrysis_carterae.AAC.1